MVAKKAKVKAKPKAVKKVKTAAVSKEKKPRGLKINGRTGRIEGRPFTSSVRKLARRASNSRASL